MNKEQVKEKKPQNRKLKMTFAIIFLVAFFIVELYLMMNYPKNYLLLGAIGLVILCLVYLITDLVFKIQNEKEDLSEKEYENIFKSEKVSYVLMKQNFLELAEILEEIRENSSFPVEELIKAQKSVAKVTIQRSKENATAIMNSNDRLLEHMIALEGRLNDGFSSKQEEADTSANKVEDCIKEEAAKLVSSMEAQMRELSDKIAGLSEVSITTTANSSQVVPEKLILSEEPIKEEEPVIPEEPIKEEEPVIPEEPMKEEETVVSEEPTIPQNSDPNHIMTPEEIAALLGETTTMEESEPVEEEKPAMPDLSDPGHVMTPDEIATLLANM